MSFPSEEEQILVKNYVMNRPLYRPAITYVKFIICVGLILGAQAICSWGIYLLLRSLGYSLNKVFFFTIIFFTATFFTAKHIAVLCIELYQRYADEGVRRRCLLKPTCSEYAIIVIKKYGLLIGGIKTWIRLNYKCRGNVYYIDEP